MERDRKDGGPIYALKLFSQMNGNRVWRIDPRSLGRLGLAIVIAIMITVPSAHAESLGQLADAAYWKEHNYAKAVELYTRALQELPENSKYWNARGDANQALAKERIATEDFGRCLNSAIRDYTKAIEYADSENARFIVINLWSRAQTYILLNDLPSAASDFDRANEESDILSDYYKGQLSNQIALLHFARGAAMLLIQESENALRCNRNRGFSCAIKKYFGFRMVGDTVSAQMTLQQASEMIDTGHQYIHPIVRYLRNEIPLEAVTTDRTDTDPAAPSRATIFLTIVGIERSIAGDWETGKPLLEWVVNSKVNNYWWDWAFVELRRIESSISPLAGRELNDQ